MRDRIDALSQMFIKITISSKNMSIGLTMFNEQLDFQIMSKLII